MVSTQEIFNAIKEEWQKLFPTAKYSTIYGFVLVSLVLISSQLKLNLISLSIEKFFFMFGLSLIFIPFPFLVLERLWIGLKVLRYKFSYPHRKINSGYLIISFNGRVCLVDLVKKEIRWIKSWSTALDLDFIGEWTVVNFDITEPDSLRRSFRTKDGQRIKLKDFIYRPGIHTQGAPGS